MSTFVIASFQNCILSFSLLLSKIITRSPCTFLLQLEDGIVDLLAKAIDEDGLEMCIESIQKPRTIDEYVQAWHNKI